MNFQKNSKYEKQIDQLVYLSAIALATADKLCGLTPEEIKIVEGTKIDMQDQPLHFHKSFDSLLDTFRNVIAGITWLKASVKEASRFYENWPYVITLVCSVTDKEIKVDKSILSLIEKEGFNQSTPLYSQTLINFYRIFTIAIKDIVWEEPDFAKLLGKPELQFLRHIRNASAHNNQFYWGTGQSRTDTITKLPVIWRGKEINEKLGNTELYMDFLKPGDLFILLADISSSVR